MPRCFSISIQSEVAWREALRALTEPAIWIAPENSNSFSVSVVLPASGWEMMAKVRRRRTSGLSSLMGRQVSPERRAAISAPVARRRRRGECRGRDAAARPRRHDQHRQEDLAPARESAPRRSLRAALPKAPEVAPRQANEHRLQ